MHDYERKLTAYERRKSNSEKIAQFKFEPEYPRHPESKGNWNRKNEYDYIKRKHEQFQKEMDTAMPKKKPTKPVWTSVDQRLEDELWDE